MLFNTTIDAPSRIELKRSQALLTIINKAIANNGPITFSQYMNYALYHPNYGYYTQKKNIFTNKGDFITAPTISPLFAYTLGRQIKSLLNANKHWGILELGGGNGKLCADLLSYLATFNIFPNYYITEVNPAKIKITEFTERVTISSTLPKNFAGIIIANEFFDALATDLFTVQNNQVYNLLVDYDDKLFFTLEASHDDTLQDICSIHSISNDYTSEINRSIKPFFKELNDITKECVMFIFDYGYSAKEFYSSQRSKGSLCCYRKHKLNFEPLLYPGLQDISVHVNFSALAHSAKDLGFKVETFNTQANYLINNGVLDFINSLNDRQTLHTLSCPSEMGETTKTIILSKNYQLNSCAVNSCTIAHDLLHKL